MKKLKNVSNRTKMYLYRGKQYDFGANQVLHVPDGLKEELLREVNELQYVGVVMEKVMVGKRIKLIDPYKKEEPKKEVKEKKEEPVNIAIRYPRERLEKMSFSKLRKLGYKQTPEIRGSSKKELIEELLVRLNES